MSGKTQETGFWRSFAADRVRRRAAATGRELAACRVRARDFKAKADTALSSRRIAALAEQASRA